jgi:hypothetical protein
MIRFWFAFESDLQVAHVVTGYNVGSSERENCRERNGGFG